MYESRHVSKQKRKSFVKHSATGNSLIIYTTRDLNSVKTKIAISITLLLVNFP